MKQPFNQRHLVIVSGLSPQVITETIYALSKKDINKIPTLVHIITTLEGAERAKLSLLTTDTAYFPRLCADYQLSHFCLEEKNIYIVKDENNNPINDIRTDKENALVANTITNIINRLTQEENAIVHVSLAGGRKTMGFYAGYALSIFGRSQDELSHVLVSEFYENNPNFFYPTPTSQIIYTKEQKPLDAAKAKVTLAIIPFIRLRHELPSRALVNTISFNEAVTLINAQNIAEQITVNLINKKLSFSSIEVELEPVEFIFYLWLLQRHITEQEHLQKPVEGEFNQEYGQQFLILFEKIFGDFSINSRTEKMLEQGMNKEFFEQKTSKIKRKLLERLGKKLSQKYLLTRIGNRGQSTYQLPFNKNKVSIIGGTL